MGQSVFPAPAAGKTRRITTLTSGTSYTVPANVTFLNVTLVGGGSGHGSSSTNQAHPGQAISSTFSVTPGASITYAIGAGGSPNSAGGSTTMTGATTANGGSNTVGTAGLGANNQGDTNGNGATGGAGSIEIEYWV